MQLDYMPVDDLTVATNNSRTHAPDQVAQIAASMSEFGFTNPLLIDENRTIIAGHGRLAAARSLGMTTVPCVTLAGLTDDQRRAYLIADNQLPLNAGWDLDVLRAEIEALREADFSIDLLGFDASFLDDLFGDLVPPGLTDPDDVPATPADPVSVPGDVWLCGPHRVMCGDSTPVDAVDALLNGETAQLLHADPPYGMGKQKDGVENDNLYREKLDQFQMEWWATLRTFLDSNASVYIWGNAPDLWRLWYRGGLADSEDMKLCNEIVWNKQHGQGMAAPSLRSYPIATERALFFMFGAQAYSMNADNYWRGWEPLRAYLNAERDRMGWSDQHVADFFGVSSRMPSHWFSRSQWSLLTRSQYERLQTEAKGAAFGRTYDSLRAEFDSLRAEFDNTHSAMTDVWEFGRVTGDERHGHATPKPVEMMERVMKTSLPEGGLCVEPFGGSGSTLMGAERTGRRCYTMELTPAYVDVIVRRWQTYTGQRATLESTGEPFPDAS